MGLTVGIEKTEGAVEASGEIDEGSIECRSGC